MKREENIQILILFCIFVGISRKLMMKYNNIYILLISLVCLLFSCTNENTRLGILQAERRSIEDTIANGHDSYALQRIEEYMNKATDSTEYYLWLSTRNKAFYKNMLADSMLVVDRRLQSFLNRYEDIHNEAMDLLRAEWLLSKGVMQTTFMSRPDLALDYNIKATSILRRYDDNKELLLTALTNTADYYRQIGKLDFSADAYLQALALADSLPTNSNARIVVELGIATAYSFMADYDNGNYWWQRLETKVDSMRYDDQFIFYNNRGNDLYFQQRYKEAMPYFEKAVALTQNKPQKEWDYYTALANLGEIYVCLGKPKEARKAIDDADNFFKKVGFTIGCYYTTTSYIGLALLEGKTGEALRMISNSRTLDHMIPAAVMQRLQKEEQAMSLVGDFRKAYTIRKQVETIRDSIQTANMKMRMNANLLKYQHDKRLAEQLHIIDQQRIITITAWGLLSGTLMVVAILIVLIMLQRKRNQLQKIADREQLIKLRMENARNRISPHFIYNALNHELLAQMKGGEVNLNSLTQLIRRGVAQANNLETTLKEELEFVDYYVAIEGAQMGDDFCYTTDISMDVDTEKVHLPSMMVQIFVENAIKHGLRAMPKRQDAKRQLLIRISRCANSSTKIEVIDNGLGLNEINSSNSSTRTGMRIVSQTIQILNDKNKYHIAFGMANSSVLEPDHTGCCSWIMIPDAFDYTL